MMHRMLIILLLAVISSIASAQQGLVEATWFEIETSNFHVFSQLSRTKTLQLAQKLETWRHAVAPFINSDEQLPPPPVPNNVYLFADEEGYREVVVGLEGGYFLPSPRENHMPLYDDENGSSLRLGLHQYTHFLTRNYHPQDLPRWYEEGLAGYLSALNITDTGVEMPQYTAAAFESSLQISRYMPLEKLIFDASALSSPALIQVANRKSTDFLHYLLHAWEDQGFKDRRVHLTNYLDLINEGREHRYAFRRAFAMSSPRMDRDLSRYLRDSVRPPGEFNGAPSTGARSTEISSDDISEMSAVTATMALAELSLRVGNFTLSHDLFKATGQADPALARSHTGVGDALRMQEPEVFDEEIDVSNYYVQAVSLSPLDPYILLDYGEYWEAELERCDNGFSDQRIIAIQEDIREHYRRALAIAPDLAEVSLAYAQVFLFEGQDWQQGVEYQHKAFEILRADPFVMELAINYAVAAQDYTRAYKLIDLLARPLHNWGEPEWVSQLRDSVDTRRRGEKFDACASED